MLAASIVALAVVTISAADNWPQWRGPEMNGISTETGLPLKWSTEQNIAWKLAMPSHTGATPIIWKDHIFLNVATHDSSGDLELWCVDRNKGQVVWKRPLGAGNHIERKQNMSSPSPVTDGTHVWAMTGTGHLRAFDFAGNQIWARDIQADYGRFGLNWGYASSPRLYQDALFVQVLHGMKTDDPSYLLRIDKNTGKTVWKVERPTAAIRESPDAYNTPAIITHDGTAELVISGGDDVTGHDPATGKELWRSHGLNPRNDPNYRIIASTLIAGNVIISPTRESPMLALKPGGRGDVTSTHRLWSFDRGPDVPSPVSDGKYVYVLTDRGVVHCLDLQTGKIVYGPARLRPDNYSASPVLADGKIYVISENDGVTSVFSAGPKFELLAENSLNDYCLSSLAVSEGQIFIRTTQYLWAIGKRR